MDKMRIVISMSTANVTLGQAEKIIDIAQNHADISKTLSACSIVPMAASLEQATRITLSFLAASQAVEEKTTEDRTPAGLLFRDSLRRRIVGLPALCSSNRFLFDHRSPNGKAIHELVSLRNKLVHVEEDALVLDSSDTNVSVNGSKVTITLPESILDTVWDSIDLVYAKSLLAATQAYFDEVIYKEKPSEGSLLKRAQRYH